MIRPATDDDAPLITALLDAHRRDPALVPRPLHDVRRHIGEFLVATSEERMLGCVAVHDHGRRRRELLSLAVCSASQRRGHGRRLVKAAIDRAHRSGGEALFAISARPALFTANGFEPVGLSAFGAGPLLRRGAHVLRQPLPRLLAAARLRFVCLRRTLEG